MHTKQISGADTDRVISFVQQHYQQAGDLIYPGLISGSLHLPIDATYRILFALERQGMIRHCHQVRCPECSAYCKQSYDYLVDVPETVCCEHCGHVIQDSLPHTIVLFQKT